MSRLKLKISAMFGSIVVGAMGIFAAVIGTVFLSLAAFIWIQQRYNTVGACLLLGAFYFSVTLILFLVGYFRKKKVESELLRASTEARISGGLSVPDLILSLFTRDLEKKRITSIVALAAVVALAILDLKRTRRSKSEAEMK
jgi:hypothetical protein